MKWLAVVLSAILLATSAVAFEGRVVNPTGDPVARAEVTVLGYSGSTPTDDDGRFVWTPDPAVPFELLVILPGGSYSAPILVEALPDRGPLEIVIEPLRADTVTVTAGAAPSIEAPAAAATSIIPRESIAERHPARLTDMIKSLPGAGTLSDVHSSVPSLRGLARGRTLLLLDGARVTTERRAGPSAAFLDPFFLEGVEVSRGPGSVAYGSDAFGGVIHARTRRAERGAPTTVRVRTALGARLPEASAGVEIGRGFDTGGVLFQARHRTFDDYQSPDGRVFNSQASDSGVLLRADFETGPGLLTVRWQADRARDTGRPDTRGESVVTAYPEERSERFTVNYDLKPRAGFTRIGFSSFWGSNGLETERERLADGTDPRSISTSEVTARDFGVRTLAVRPIGDTRWEFGLDLNGRYGLEALGSLATFDETGAVLTADDEVAIDRARRIDTALYSRAETPLGTRFLASGGLRFDRVTTKSSGGFFGDESSNNVELSGYASLRVELARGLSVTSQLAHGFRDPTLSDRYFRGISGRGLVTGNPDLEPEEADQIDVALRYVHRGVRAAIYGYSYRFSDLIERFEDADDLFFFRNRGEADIEGVELELQTQWGDGYTLEIGAQTSRGETGDDDAPLDDIPARNARIELRRSFGDGTYGEIRASFFAEDDRPGPSEIDVPGYTVVDVSAGFRLSPTVRLRFRVSNLLDKSLPVSPDARAVRAPGLNGVASIVAEF